LRIASNRKTASLPQTPQRCGREFETVLQFSQYTATFSGILQIAVIAGSSITFAIRASPLGGLIASFSFLSWFRESATDPEASIGLRQSSNLKSIDAEGLDDLFLVALTEHFVGDQPARASAAHRALDESHG
jgi:hypothetical protein